MVRNIKSKNFIVSLSLASHLTVHGIQPISAALAKDRRNIASYPPHELEARTKGIPTLGSGRIFPVPEHAIAIEQMDTRQCLAKLIAGHQQSLAMRAHQRAPSQHGVDSSRRSDA
jgi:hypothetical protein